MLTTTLTVDTTNTIGGVSGDTGDGRGLNHATYQLTLASALRTLASIAVRTNDTHILVCARIKVATTTNTTNHYYASGGRTPITVVTERQYWRTLLKIRRQRKLRRYAERLTFWR